MKLKILIPILLLVLAGCTRDILEEAPPDGADGTRASLSSDYYYGYEGKKEYLTKVPEKFFVIYKKDKAGSLTRSGASLAEASVSDYPLWASINKTAAEAAFADCAYTTVSATVDKLSEAVYYAPYYKTESGAELGVTNKFMVELKKAEDFDLLESFAEANNVLITGNSSFAPLWYYLHCTSQSEGNALQMANKAYESGQFAATDVSFEGNVVFMSSSSYNDPLYKDQWNLKNNDYAGMDINFEGVHSVTTGDPSVTIAVIDNGAQLDHPDMKVDLSWDAFTHSSPSRIYQSKYQPEAVYHGTACSSVIGATANNGRGIVGIAPDASLMVISVNADIDAETQFGDAFYYAAKNGATVLSCSWSVNSSSNYLFEAVRHALTEGRDGKGCVVVFASGNDGDDRKLYPQCVFADLLSVGSTNREGKKADFSNYGSFLDVVAPGERIPMLNLNGSTIYDDGTSYSCPQVAAVAGLVLSVAPELSGRSVNDIIARTAQKVGGYDYSINGSNGSWCHEMGNGLVNAYEAVRAMSTTDMVSGKTIDGKVDYMRSALLTSNMTITSGASVNISTVNGVIALPSIRIEKGAELRIDALAQ